MAEIEKPDRADDELNTAISQSNDLQLLLARAAVDRRLAAAMIGDLDAVLRENNLVVSPESELYQELAVRLFHIRTITERMFDELRDRHMAALALPLGPIKYGSLIGFFPTISDWPPDERV